MAELAGKIAEKVYKSTDGDATEAASAAGENESAEKDENVVDADFEEVKNEKD